MTVEEKLILEDYRKAFRNYCNNKKIIDLDGRVHNRPGWSNVFLVARKFLINIFERIGV
jgi:hypothetical protein